MKKPSISHQSLIALGAGLAVGVTLALLPISGLQASNIEHLSAEKMEKHHKHAKKCACKHNQHQCKQDLSTDSKQTKEVESNAEKQDSNKDTISKEEAEGKSETSKPVDDTIGA